MSNPSTSAPQGSRPPADLKAAEAASAAAFNDQRARRSRQIENIAIAVFALFAIVVVPILHATGRISTFEISLWGKYLCYALLAISVNVLWGYTGLLSLGQALFFTLGGYMHGMYLMRMIGALGQAHKPIPDFLVFLGWTKLPSFWEPFSSFPFALAMILLVPGLVAYIYGYLAFRSRIRGVYFSILTQALTYAASILFFRNNLLLGGNNGFTDFKFILGHSLVDRVEGPVTMRGLYIVTAVALLAIYLFCRWLNGTKFGLVQQAIRDGENRVLFSGYATTHYKLFVFVLAALIAAIGGALFVPQAGIINPEEMKAQNSVEAVVWVAVGGRGTLVGPVIGAVYINALKSWASRAYPDLWLILLGLLCLLVVLFMPRGMAGYSRQFWTLTGFDAPRNPAAARAPSRLLLVGVALFLVWWWISATYSAQRWNGTILGLPFFAVVLAVACGLYRGAGPARRIFSYLVWINVAIALVQLAILHHATGADFLGFLFRSGTFFVHGWLALAVISLVGAACVHLPVFRQPALAAKTET